MSPCFNHTSIEPSLSYCIEDQASSFFINGYVHGNFGSHRTYFDYLPALYKKSPMDSALSNIITALGMAFLSNVRAPKLVSVARAKYALALRSINATLTDPVEVKTDQTLMTVMLLGLYEVCRLLISPRRA